MTAATRTIETIITPAASRPASDAGPLASIARPVTAKAGEVVYTAGPSAAHLVIVHEGLVRVETATSARRERLLVAGIAGRGEVLAFMVRDGEAESAHEVVRAVTDSRLSIVALADLRTHAHHAPATVAALVAAIADSGSRTRTLAAESALLPTSCMLARTVLRLAERFGRTRGDGSVEVELEISHQELAELVGSRRPRVTQLLSMFKQSGALETRYRRLIITDPQKLAWFAQAGATVEASAS